MSTLYLLRSKICLDIIERDWCKIISFDAGVKIPPVNLPVKHHLMAMQVPMHVCQVVA
jgi:hypothetical protein